MIDISTLIVKPEHNIIIKYNTNEHSNEEIQLYLKYLTSIFPNNEIVLKPNGIELEVDKK